MPGAAAFFDLDRTLLLGGSGPTISDGLRRGGLLPGRRSGIERLLFGVFDSIGETLPSIAITRQGARAAKGWEQTAVQAVGREVAPSLVERVEPYARQAIDRHRAHGDRIVLATTTPHDLVAPFAEALGFDALLATRYRVDGDGRYTGEIDGEFVWSRGKARSVGVWAAANGVDLRASHAYSDSIFDTPMLSLVGHPVAVNPDYRLLLYARGQEWPIVWFNAPPGVPKPMGVEPQRLVARLAGERLFPWIGLDLRGVEHLPTAGAAVVAANHRSYLDPVLVGLATARVGRPIRFLTKREIVDAPLVGPIVTALGVIRVDRGSGSDEPLVQAAAALDADELVGFFPEGTIPPEDALDRPVLDGRTGAARLAIQTGAPLVPIGISGSERAWPRSNRVPYVLNLADPPTVTVTVGEPYRPTTSDVDAATAELMARIVSLRRPRPAGG